MRRIIWSITFFIPIMLSGQVNPSLQELTKSADEVVTSNLDSALILYKQAIIIADKNDSLIRKGEITHNIGLAFMNIGSFDSAHYYIDQSLLIYETINSQEGMATSLSTMGNLYNYQGRFEDALEQYFDGIEIYKSLQDTFNRSRLLSNIATVFNASGRIQKSISVLNEGEHLIKNHSKSRIILGDIYNNLGNNYQALDSFGTSLFYNQKAANIYQEVGDIAYEAMVRSNIATKILEVDSTALSESKESLDRSRLLLDQIQSPRLELNYYKHLAWYYYYAKNYDRAINAALQCLEYINEFADKQNEAHLYELLYHIYKKQGDSAEALRAHERHLALRDTMMYSREQEQLLELEAKYQITVKEKEILQQDLTINERTKQRNLYISLAAIASIVGIGFYFFQRQRNTKNQRISLQQQQIATQRIAELEKENKINSMSSMIEGQEAERRRIAKDLHDGLGGLLATVRTKMSHIQSQVDALANLNIYQSANDMIDQACDEVRRISHNMMPGVLRIEGLQGAIEEIADQLKTTHNLSVDLNINFEQTSLNEAQSHMIYRIVQEACYNIVKHSQATEVILQVIDYDDHLNILIEDNGVGFNEGAKANGLGLKSIRSRVDFLNGMLDLATKDGTSISINIPISK